MTQNNATEEAGAAWTSLLAREREQGFASLGGSRAEIAVPVRQALVDRLLTRALASRSQTTAVQVELLEGARLGVTASHRVLGLPVRARTVLELDREIDLARGRLVLRHDEGALWKTIRGVAGTLGLLPAGVSFGAGTVEVDLRALLARAGLDDVLSLVQRLVIHGPADGLFAIEADVVVPHGGLAAGAQKAVSTDGRSTAPRAPLTTSDTERWLTDLAGARARVSVVVHEALANDALSIVRRLSATPSQSPSAAPAVAWTSLVNDARVRFTDQRLVLDLDLEAP